MTAPDISPTSGPRISFVSVERPSVMLVRIEPGHEPAELGLDDLPVRVLRVRHPLPACVRMRIVRPEAIFVGPSVLPRDLGLLMDVAYETQAALMPLSGMGVPRALRPWLLRMLDVVRARRGEPPAVSQAG